MRGSRPGERRGGRQPGTKNKRTVALECAQAEAAVKIADVLGPDAFAGDAHAFLMLIYKDPKRSDEMRIEAARAAISFEKPRLASIDGNIGGVITLAAVVEASLASIEERALRPNPNLGGSAKIPAISAES